MLRYVRERHIELLRERLATVPADGAAGGPVSRPITTVDPDQREEWIRRIMVGPLARIRRGLTIEPQELGSTLSAYLTCSDPADLRQVDVAHNAYEALLSAQPRYGTPPGFWRAYSLILQTHVAELANGRIRTYGVPSGEPTVIQPCKAPLRVLILADNFLSGSRIWKSVSADPGNVTPHMFFCNNAQRPVPGYALHLLGSLGVLLLRGALGLGLSMLRGRPRVSARPLGDSANTAWLEGNAFDIGLHNMGMIYRQETMAAFKRGILNAHIGYLPGMRGRSVFEWSLVLGVPPCVSTFFIDQGIDTGRLIVDRYLPRLETGCASGSVAAAKRSLFHLDGWCYRRAITRLVEGGEGILNEPSGERFYVMSELLAASLSDS